MKLKDLKPGMKVLARVPRHQDDFHPFVLGEIVEVGVGYDTEDVIRLNLQGNVAQHKTRGAYKTDGVVVRSESGREYRFPARNVEYEVTGHHNRYIVHRSPYGYGIYDVVEGKCINHNARGRDVSTQVNRLNEEENAK